jgi:ATP-dependent Clp protease ATP-binding subunit ClpA
VRKSINEDIGETLSTSPHARIDEVVIFRRFGEVELKRLVVMTLHEVVERSAGRDFTFKAAEGVTSLLMKCAPGTMVDNAREVIKLVERMAGVKLALYKSKGILKEGSEVWVTVWNETLDFDVDGTEM